MFQTLSTTRVQGQKNLSGTYQPSIFNASAEEQKYSYGPFQQGFPSNSTISVYKEDNLYSSYQQCGPTYLAAGVQGQENAYGAFQQCVPQYQGQGNLYVPFHHSGPQYFTTTDQWQQKQLEWRQQEELKQALKTLSDLVLPYIDQVVTPDSTITDCENILHLMSWSDKKHTEIAFHVLLRNKLHDKVYKAAKKVFLNQFVCDSFMFKLSKMFSCDGKMLHFDPENVPLVPAMYPLVPEMLPFVSEEGCSLLLKLIYLNKPTKRRQVVWISPESIMSIAKYFPKLVNLKYCELLLHVVLSTDIEFIEAVSSISDDNFYMCLFEACLKLINHKSTRKSIFEDEDADDDDSYHEEYNLIRTLFVCWNHLQSKKQQENVIQLLKKYKDVILSIVENMTNEDITCDDRQQYCIMLLLLLHHYHSTENVMTAIPSALTDLKVSLWNKNYFLGNQCYCYGGTKVCSKSNKFTEYITQNLLQCQIEILQHTFQYRIDYDHFTSCCDRLRFKVIKEVSVGNIKFDHYLESLTKLLFDKTNKRYADIIYKNENCTDTVVYQFSNIMEKIIDHNKEEKILNVITTLCQHEIPTELRDLLAQGLIAAFKVKYFKQTVQISKLILDMNMMLENCEFLDNLTLQIGKLLDLEGNKEEILYKRYCILRHKNRNNSSETNTTEIYREHFTFISRLEKEEEIEKQLRRMELVLLIMLLLVSVSYGGHHSSAELKKYLSLKYEYDNAILYLLWCSGDVEINPGPTLKKIMKVPPSVKKRNWIYYTASTLLKSLKGFSVDENPNQNLWDVKPEWWSEDEPFYDPRNPKGFKRNPKTDEQLLRYLIDCCKQRKIKIPQYLQNEITARINKDEKYLDHYILRQEIVEIRTAIQQLVCYKDTPELTKCLRLLKISINFSSRFAYANKNQPKSMADVFKDIKVTLVRVSHEIENPMLKCTGLIEKPPKGLKTEHLQLYKTGNGIDHDKELIGVLINYCEATGKAIPKDFHPVLDACKSGDMEKIRKCYTIWAYVAIIKHSLEYLQVEELLHKQNLHEELKELGELIDIQSWERNQHSNTNTEVTPHLSPQPGPSTQQGLPLWGSNPSQTTDDEVTLTVSPQPGPSTAHCSHHLPLANHNPQGGSSPLCSVPCQQTRFVQKTIKKTTGKGKRKPDKYKAGCTAQKRQFVCQDDDSIGGLVSSNEQVLVDSIVLSQKDVQMVQEFSSNISIGSNTAGSSGVTQSDMTINGDGTTNTTVTVSQTVSTSSPNSEQSSSLDKVMSKHCTDSDSNGQQIGSPTLDDKFKQILRELNL